MAQPKWGASAIGLTVPHRGGLNMAAKWQGARTEGQVEQGTGKKIMKQHWVRGTQEPVLQAQPIHDDISLTLGQECFLDLKNILIAQNCPDEHLTLPVCLSQKVSFQALCPTFICIP